MNYTGELNKDGAIIEGNQNILIYGCGTGSYGEKIFRNLKLYHRERSVCAFIDHIPQKIGKSFHGLPIMEIKEGITKYPDSIVCIGGENSIEIKKLKLLQEICTENLHQIIFDKECKRYGSEYGGFYLPSNFVKESGIVYSFGIGEDLSFSEDVIEKGGYTVYAFDPTPKAVKYIKSHKLFSNTKFHFMEYGLSNLNGEEKFYMPNRDEYVSASIIDHSGVDNEKAIYVKMKTIRTIMKEMGHKKIDILKMDIEGAEFKVVKDIMNPKLEPVDCRLICMETHERFFESKKCVDRMYDSMQKNGFFDIYGTTSEPTFIKI